ncbi:HNH endonuclease [Egicoccus sp. AB-alg2]|uniref:HNH endonuclease n=1 Tax=Egicoccus sp. AB-alg2 TaxID=3242693 RepID=UPI00359D37A4
MPDAEAWLLEWADRATAAELEHLARGLRTAQRPHQLADEPDPAGWAWRTRQRPDGMAELTITGPAEAIAELETRCRRAAATAAAETPDGSASAETDPDGSRSASAETDGGGSASAEADHHGSACAETDEPADRLPWPTGPQLARTLADAVIAGTANGPPDTTGLDRHTLVLHTPADALAPPSEPAPTPVPVRDPDGRLRTLDRRVLRRLACEAGIVLAITGPDHQPLDLGRRRRALSSALRRAILLRDHHRCRFPGCTTTRNLHVHHIRHWADGGPTDRANLITLCAHHHRYLHQQADTARNWHITIRPDGHHTFHHPDGHQIPHAGSTPAITTAAAAHPSTAAGTVTVGADGRPQPGDPTPTLTSPAAPAIDPSRPLAPLEWDGPGHYDLDLAVAVLQQHLDRIATFDDLLAA